jgi:tetratricopeptide (TPR) repeat protein
VAVCYEKLVHFCQQFEQNEEACEYGQQQLQILAKIAAADPANADAQRELAAEYNKLGLLRWGAGLLDQARESFQHAFDFYARRAAANPKDESAVSHVDESCANLAGLARSRGDLDTAEKICQHGITLLTQLGVKPPVQPYLRSSAMFAMNSELRGCAETRIITGPLDALLKKPADQMPGLLYHRAHLLAARRDIDGVAKTADALDALARLEPKQAWKLFYAACAYGVCAKLASGWPGYGPFPPTKAAGKNAEDVKAHTPTDGQRYARAAIDLLQAAEKAGYKNIRSARSHPDFAALGDVPDFKKLVGGAP